MKPLMSCGRVLREGDDCRVCYGIDHYRRAWIERIDNQSRMVTVRLESGAIDSMRFNQIC